MKWVTTPQTTYSHILRSDWPYVRTLCSKTFFSAYSQPTVEEKPTKPLCRKCERLNKSRTTWAGSSRSW